LENVLVVNKEGRKNICVTEAINKVFPIGCLPGSVSTTTIKQAKIAIKAVQIPPQEMVEPLFQETMGSMGHGRWACARQTSAGP